MNWIERMEICKILDFLPTFPSCLLLLHVTLTMQNSISKLAYASEKLK